MANLSRKLKKCSNTEDVMEVIADLIEVVDQLAEKVEDLLDEPADGKKKNKFFQFGND